MSCHLGHRLLQSVSMDMQFRAAIRSFVSIFSASEYFGM